LSDVNIPNVQGNILKGFNKPEIRFIFFEAPYISDKEKGKEIRKWFCKFADRIPNTPQLIKASENLKEKMEINRKETKENGRYEPPNIWDPNYSPRETWVHVSFTYRFLKRLGLSSPHPIDSSSTDQVIDKIDPFEVGMKARKDRLGDIRSDDPSNIKSNWIEPFKNGNIDGVFIIASDKQGDADIYSINLIDEITSIGIKCIGLEKGSAITNEEGKQIEHFGFVDGISQPLINKIDNDKIKERLINKEKFNANSFVLSNLKGDLEWANDGSFMVFRKLKQNVDAFWEFMNKKSKELNTSPESLAAKFIGRWKSGAPLLVFPNADPHTPSESDFNDFKYIKNELPDKDTKKLRRTYDEVKNWHDEFGIRTPRFAHIRKVYPRDDGKKGDPEIDDKENDAHRILRRGIPYGPTREHNPFAERGLLFVCYQKDLRSQFEYIQRSFANDANFPKADPRFNESTIIEKGHGIDAIIGSNRKEDKHGNPIEIVNLVQKETGIGMDSIIPITGFQKWIETRGGEYFFSPSLHALKNIIFKT
jgi:Dyp-type peroxidase family